MRQAAASRAPNATAGTESSTSTLRATRRRSFPIEFFDEPTLVSKRVGCIVLRPVLDLTAACLKP